MRTPHPKKNPSPACSRFLPRLSFSGPTPVAPDGLGGLVRDHFSNGRLYATTGWHGGLMDISYWGNQHLTAAGFFEGKLETAWGKLFRPCVGLGEKRYYLPLSDTKLYPFGWSGRSRVIGVDFTQEMLLLPDALVQRFGVLRNPRKLPVFIEMFHQERICRREKPNRTWSEFEFHPKLNALIGCCTDRSFPRSPNPDEKCLAQEGVASRDIPEATTWIGVGCDAPIKIRRSFNSFKLYITSKPIQAKEVSFFVVFASSRKELERRIAELSKTVHEECEQLVSGYEQRLLDRPRIRLGNPVLDSAFAQYPEVVHFMKVRDRSGAVRATQAGYFVWGWDGMTPLVSCALANEPEYTADILRFFQETIHPELGIPHAFNTGFELMMKNPVPSQAQYIAGLYHYIATTGDLEFAREVLPTCKFILDRCREHLVKKTGLVSGYALWPDFPEAMDENGHDISSMNNSLLYQGLRSIEYIARALGDSGLADECRDWAKLLRASFVKYLYDEEEGYFISSCSSKTLKPRKHCCGQAIFWVTPFARELVSHAPGRISAFMDKHLRSEKCLLSLPQWDPAWMADGNQLGSSFPASDYFYVNVHKLTGDDHGLKTWLGDVEWFWRYHTAPEAFTPEADNEHEFGPDNHGAKQLQAVTTWYSCLYNGVAGMDFDHEGLTLTPWGDMPVDIRGLRLHGVSIDLKISGSGKHVGKLTLDGKPLAAGSRKIPWAAFKGRTAKVALVRSEKAPGHPVIVRADGLRVASVTAGPGRLSARIEGAMTGEVVVQAAPKAKILVDGLPVKPVRESATGTVSIPFENRGKILMEIVG